LGLIAAALEGVDNDQPRFGVAQDVFQEPDGSPAFEGSDFKTLGGLTGVVSEELVPDGDVASEPVLGEASGWCGLWLGVCWDRSGWDVEGVVGEEFRAAASMLPGVGVVAEVA
jgi:hypothetical protein